MTPESWTGDSLSPNERDEYESDLIAFCDRELDLLGEIEGLDVLYAGGTSPLWIEGLALRLGDNGSLMVLDLDDESLELAAGLLERDPDLPLRPRFVAGDVFDLPFESDSFDLAYSSGLFHELDARRGSAPDAIAELARVVRPGGTVATSDFVDDLPAAQLDEESIEAEISRLSMGARLLGVSESSDLISIHEQSLVSVKRRLSPPFHLRHLERSTLARKSPPGTENLQSGDLDRLDKRWSVFLQRVREEGYTRPATLFVSGEVV